MALQYHPDKNPGPENEEKVFLATSLKLEMTCVTWASKYLPAYHMQCCLEHLGLNNNL